MGIFNMFKSKPSREQTLQGSVKGQMSPELAEIAYTSYRDNGELYAAAQQMSDEQVQECYEFGFLLMTYKSYSEQTHQIMGLAAMGGHAHACARMAFLQPSIESVWEDFADPIEYSVAKSALERLVGRY